MQRTLESAWSLQRTPFFMRNPRRLPRGEASPKLLPWAHAMEDLRTIMDSPTPWRFLEEGFVLYDGPSLIDGAPILAIVTGTSKASVSGNVKTGPMLQTWILRKDVSPQAAVDQGLDGSICGDCMHRGTVAEKPVTRQRKVITPSEARRGFGVVGGPQTRRVPVEQVMEGRSCYVVVSQAPDAVWKAYYRGNYGQALRIEQIPLIGHGRVSRLGSYGDPAAVPVEIWEALIVGAVGWTGYTHQWCEPSAQRYRHFLMASVDTREQLAQARDAGWRTFRVLRGDEALVAGTEIQCPASAEGGFTKTCDACRACRGRPSPSHGASVAISVHPRWQVLYDVETGHVRAHRVLEKKKGKKASKKKPAKKVKGKAGKKKPAVADLPQSRSEIVVVDYLAGGEIRGLVKVVRKALKSGAPSEYLAERRHEFPSYVQGYFDLMIDYFGQQRSVHENPLLAVVGMNPGRRSHHEISSAIEHGHEALERALEDAAPRRVVDSIGHKLDVLESALGRAVRPNPYVHPLAFEARHRFHEDQAAGHDDAAEYWRGQAGALFTSGGHDPAPKRPKAVAGESSKGRLKSKGKSKKAVRKNRTTGNSAKPNARLKGKISVAEARKRFEGMPEARKAYRTFHEKEGNDVELYEIDDGSPDLTVAPVHAALHRTLETNYWVPWEGSNKTGTLWLHEHKEGRGLKGLSRGKGMPNPEDLPLEIYDPRTKTTRKIAGKFKVSKWWYD